MNGVRTLELSAVTTLLDATDIRLQLRKPRAFWPAGNPPCLSLRTRERSLQPSLPCPVDRALDFARHCATRRRRIPGADVGPGSHPISIFQLAGGADVRSGQ